MPRFRVGVVGAGVGFSHAEMFQQLPDLYEVVAVCEVDEQRRKAFVDRFGVAIETDRLEDLFSHDLDLLDISTPSSLHFSQACTTLRAGFDVILEKPIARSLAEIDQLTEVAQQTGKQIFPIFQYRFGHGIQKLHHLIAKGLAGRPFTATAETHWFRGEKYYTDGPWRKTWDGAAGGCFAIHSIHIHDLLCEVLGDPTSVYAQTSNPVNGFETEDTGALVLTFANGAMATSSVTLGSVEQMSRLRFCFEGVSAEGGRHPYNPGHEPWTFAHDDPIQKARIEEALSDFSPQPERFPGQFFRIHQALTGSGPSPVTLADARRSIEMLTAAYWSVRTGEAVRLPISKDHPFYSGWVDTMKSSA
jgi:predicted dehydrogenase